ncbi:MAG: recombinase family protein, partial [Bacillota bacterium]
YSEQDYIIHWIDGIDTEIGDIRCCRGRAEELQGKNLMNIGELIPDTSVPVQEPLQVDTETVVRLLPTKDTVTEIIQIKEDIILNYRKEEDIIAKPEVMRIDNIQHMKMLHRIRKDIKESKVPTLHSKHKEKLKVAAYVRVSTDHEEQETSLKTQTAFYTYTILSNPEYSLAGIYVDEGISATSTKNRDGFNQMIRDCKAGKIDLILTKSISRFARNTVDAIHYSRLLKNLNKPVNIFFEKENVSTKDDNAELMVTLLGALAQQESRNIGSSISWGKRAKASRGIVNVRRLNYGYEFNENKEWAIKEDEAAIIRRIYSAYLAGAKPMEIARDLNKDKVIPASGSGLWGSSGINKILFNHIYNGDYVHNNMYRDPELKQSLVRNRGEVPMIHIENHHPAIIDRDMWESVQELRNHKQRTRKKIKQEFNNEDKRNESFDDKFTCGECGSS